MKYIILLSILLFSSYSQSGEMSGSVSVGGDYLFRGVSQNQGPALSGQIGVESNGYHGSIWASQVDFDSEATFEYDLTLGKTFTAGDISFDVSYIEYKYFDEEALDLEEVALTFGYKAVSLAYFAGLSDAADYMEIGVDLGFAQATLGTMEDLGTNWSILKTIDVEGFDTTFGYRYFHGEDGIPDEKSAVLMVTKSF